MSTKKPSVRTLRAEAKRLGIRGYSKLAKADLARVITAHYQAAPELDLLTMPLPLVTMSPSAAAPMHPGTHAGVNFKDDGATGAQIDLEDYLKGDRRPG